MQTCLLVQSEKEYNATMDDRAHFVIVIDTGTYSHLDMLL
jgi:hypothetical protein